MASHLNLVVVEDHHALRELTVEGLRAQGHRVLGVDCAEALQEVFAGQTMDIVVLDLNLPGEDGLSVAKRLRQRQPALGIIILTARSQLEERLQGYESGADIYLSKPVLIQELGAVVMALGQRIKHSAANTAGLCLHMASLTLLAGERQIRLTTQEANLLSALARAPGQRLAYWQLLAQLGMQDKTLLEPHVSRLRAKLSDAGGPANAIRAIRHYGYQLGVALTLG